MKKVETKYYCDVCGEQIEDNKGHHARVPRIVRQWATDAHGTKLKQFEIVTVVENDLCKKCASALAGFMPPIDEDMDTGYAE